MGQSSRPEERSGVRATGFGSNTGRSRFKGHRSPSGTRTAVSGCPPTFPSLSRQDRLSGPVIAFYPEVQFTFTTP